MARHFGTVAAACLSTACLSLAGCSVPSSGPSRSAVQTEANVDIVDVTYGSVLSMQEPLQKGFPESFVRQPLPTIDRISLDEKLQLQVFENVDKGLFGATEAGPTVIAPLTVDSEGKLSVPYVGRIDAVGKSLEELRAVVEEKLAEQTPDPQVIVSRMDESGLSVSISGDIRQPGIYPLDIPTRRINALLSRAGGVAASPDQVKVEIRRGRNGGSAGLRAIQDDPRQDVAVLPGDNVVVRAEHRRVFVLGAIGAQKVIPLDQPNMVLIDAVAASGGLNNDAANPEAVYVFRRKAQAGTQPPKSDSVGTVFRFNFSEPTGVLAAGEFGLWNSDVIYIAETGNVRFSRVLKLLLGVTLPAKQISDMATGG